MEEQDVKDMEESAVEEEQMPEEAEVATDKVEESAEVEDEAEELETEAGKPADPDSAEEAEESAEEAEESAEETEESAEEGEEVEEDGEDDEDDEEEEEEEEEEEPALPTPSHEECLALLEEFGASPELVAHSEAVTVLALKMAEMYDLHNDRKCDTELVTAGSLLHDLGRVKTHDITHNIEGSQLLREKGHSKELCLIVERHVGAGIDVSETEELKLPPRNYIPQKLEERIVAHADNLIDGTKRVKVQDLIRKLVEKEELKYAARLIRLHNKLSKLCGIEIDEIE